MEILVFALIATTKEYVQHQPFVPEAKFRAFDLRPLRHPYNVEDNSSSVLSSVLLYVSPRDGRIGDPRERPAVQATCSLLAGHGWSQCDIAQPAHYATVKQWQTPWESLDSAIGRIGCSLTLGE